ncbi:MAG: hypothetical protein MHM6MM_002946 [Cercozoa sp. M6MM]
MLTRCARIRRVWTAQGARLASEPVPTLGELSHALTRFGEANKTAIRCATAGVSILMFLGIVVVEIRLSSKVDEFNGRIEAINGRIDAMHSDLNSRADAIRSDMSRVLCAALNVRSHSAAGQSDSSSEDSSSDHDSQLPE